MTGKLLNGETSINDHVDHGSRADSDTSMNTTDSTSGNHDHLPSEKTQSPWSCTEFRCFDLPAGLSTPSLRFDAMLGAMKEA